MIVIRPYKPDDLAMIASWNREYGYAQVFEHLISPTSYVAEVDGRPVAALSLILTNCQWVAMIENVIGNPASSTARREAIPILMRYAEEKAKEHGVKTLFISAFVDKVKDRYEGLGFSKATENLTMFFKNL